MCHLLSDKPHWGCCCVCQNQYTIYSVIGHKKLGYVCIASTQVNNNPERIVDDCSKHGVCEMHQFREDEHTKELEIKLAEINSEYYRLQERQKQIVAEYNRKDYASRKGHV
jgi:hypothetical protein